MVSLKCSGAVCLRNASIGHWTYLLTVIIILFTSFCQVQAGVGDRHHRQAPELPQTSTEVTLSPTDPCYTFYNTSNNQFYSPGYPEVYMNNSNCEMVLEAPPGHLIKLDFRDWFQIEESPECKNDYLEVRDGRHGYNKLLESRFCGIDVFPPMITSSDRHLWIHFKSDENLEYKGFKAVFEFIPRPASLKTPEIIPCNYTITGTDEELFGRFNISSDIMHFVEENDNVPIDCLWNITVKENWKIYLQFDKFSLEKPNDCDTNFVQVFSTKTKLDYEEKKFCGSIAETVLSKKNVMFVRFYSLSKNNKTNFIANFTAYRDMGTGSKHQGCSSDEFYCEDATCIHESLKCNGKYNCRFRWDEDGCQSADPLSWSGDHIIIIMIIFSLILTGMCITFIYNCITKLISDHKTIQEYILQSREQQLNELGKSEQMDTKASSKVRSRSVTHHTSPSIDCYVPGGDIIPIPIGNEPSRSPSNDDDYATDIYTVDDDRPETCNIATQTRDSLITQNPSSGNSSPNHSTHTNSPPAPFSTFGYKKDSKFKAEAKIEVGWMIPSETRIKKYIESPRRPYSVQTTKSAPDVIVTH